MIDFEKLGKLYLGRRFEPELGEPDETPVLYDSKDLTTHAVCVGMTGSGKTGLCLTLLEEAAIDGIPALCIDPKGDLGNLMLTFPELRPSVRSLARRPRALGTGWGANCAISQCRRHRHLYARQYSGPPPSGPRIIRSTRRGFGFGLAARPNHGRRFESSRSSRNRARPGEQQGAHPIVEPPVPCLVRR